MQKLTAALLLGMFSFLIPQSQNNLKKMILGNWRFDSGKYIYFDNANKKLKESRITELEKLSVEVKPQTARIVYPDHAEFEGNYTLSKNNGKNYVNVNFDEKAIQYQITSITKSAITLQARHNIQFFVDGDEKRRASYSLVVIQLKR